MGAVSVVIVALILFGVAWKRVGVKEAAIIVGIGVGVTVAVLWLYAVISWLL